MVKVVPMRSSGMTDPGWEHGVAQDDRKKKVKCNYCGKVVSGGIYRLKQHLARVSGEVTYCEKAPEEVYLRMKENLEGNRPSKKARRCEDEAQGYLNLHYEDEEESVGHRSKGKQLTADRGLGVNFTPVRSLGYVDPGWEHGVAQDERKKKVRCKYCEKVVSGGINRFKQHLARIPGEVAPCKNAPEEVYLKIKENMKWHRSGRRQRHLDGNDLPDFSRGSDSEEDEEHQQEKEALIHMSNERLSTGDRRSGRDLRINSKEFASIGGFGKRSRLDSVFLNSSSIQASVTQKQAKVRNGSFKKYRKEVISAICKFFYHAGVPSQAADSIYFHKMLELVGQYGPGLVGPQSQLISGRLLQEEVATIKSNLVDYKASWAVTGCSVIADIWTDIEGRALINLLVSCPHGVYFIASVDGTDMLEDASSLFKLLDNTVEDIGEQNVVQLITENTPSFKAAGKMLEEKRTNLFWTPCATSCIDKILEDFLKIKCAAECIEKGQKITKFIYNRIWLLNLLKRFIQGQELLKSAATRHASSFATLQSLLDQRNSLRRMFQSSEWISSRFSKLNEGKEVEKIVSNATFWKKVQFVSKSVDPIIQVLQKVGNAQNLSMPHVYSDMCKAKFAIKAIDGDDDRRSGPFSNVLRNHWNSFSCHPLYMAAYFLNPSYRNRSDYWADSEAMRGLNTCISRLEPDETRKVSASKQIPDYASAKGDFGTELAISTRTELEPAAWWQQHGISCLELQRIAVRILSQTCSSLGCEHSWSIYDQIHRQRRNRLAQKRLNDLVFVHYNLRLREGQLNKRTDGSSLPDNVLVERLLDDWIVGADKQTVEEDEGTFDGENGTCEDRYEDGFLDYQDGTTEGQKGTLAMATMADNVEPLDVHPLNTGGASDDDDDDDDDDQNFFDDNLSG